MNKQKPILPKGMRDFGAEEVFKRNHITDTVKEVFRTCGYLPLETPAVEQLSVLAGAYGEEGDRLIFKILNSGDFLNKLSDEDRLADYREMAPKITEKALRYDLTVPFARYTAMNRHDIVFPFKRYQIQPVWRADRPQKGRFREFYQCDADVIGSTSLICEAEMITMITEVLTRLTIKDFTIKINSRKVLSGMAAFIGAADAENDLFIELDKTDKIGFEKVKENLSNKGFSPESIAKLDELVSVQGNNEDKLTAIGNYFKTQNSQNTGVQDLKKVLDYVSEMGCSSDSIEFTPLLARGLAYYTGMIFEVIVNDYPGSITGGGRYDNLAGAFGMPDVSGVGISFGLDRIVEVMELQGIKPQTLQPPCAFMVCNFGEISEKHCLRALSTLRKAGIHSDIYPENAKLKKQLDYANRKGIPYVILIGPDEVEEKVVIIKHMASGKSETLSSDDLESRALAVSKQLLN